MTRSTELLSLSPTEPTIDALALARGIDACLDAAAACIACADACLAEPEVAELRRCIALDSSCADVCAMSARTLARLLAHDMELVTPTLQLCVRACELCARECERHADHHAHCRACAYACRECERACQGLLTAIA
jgi:hypothetical protein